MIVSLAHGSCSKHHDTCWTEAVFLGFNSTFNTMAEVIIMVTAGVHVAITDPSHPDVSRDIQGVPEGRIDDVWEAISIYYMNMK